MIPQDVVGQPMPANKSNVDISVKVGDCPNGIAVNPNNDLVYVANSCSNTVSVIDSTTNEVLINNITVGHWPEEIVVNPNNDSVYVANSEPTVIAVNPNNDLVYVANTEIGYTEGDIQKEIEEGSPEELRSRYYITLYLLYISHNRMPLLYLLYISHKYFISVINSTIYISHK